MSIDSWPTEVIEGNEFTISGSATGTEYVEITFGDWNLWTAQVDADGNWSLTTILDDDEPDDGVNGDDRDDVSVIASAWETTCTGDPATCSTVEVTDDVVMTLVNADPQIQVDALPDPILGGQDFILSGSVDDPGWPDTLTLTIDWDDGTALDEYFPMLGDAFDFTHVYPNQLKDYTIKVTVTDDDGGVATEEVTAHVVFQLTIDEFPTEVDEGESFMLTGMGPVGETVTLSAGGVELGTVIVGSDGYWELPDAVIDDDEPDADPIDRDDVVVTLSYGTESTSEIILVNNVAPMITIVAITPIDTVSIDDGGVDGRLDETEGFVVTGIVTDPGKLDTFPVAKMEVDLNFDGNFAWSASGGNESHLLTLVPLTSDPGKWTFEQTITKVADDGPFGLSGPSNHTANDLLMIKVTVEDDDTGNFILESDVLVHNLAPTFTDLPTLAVTEDANGNPIGATLSGTFADAGTADQHSLIVKWGGQEYVYVLPTGTRAFNVQFPPQWVLTWERLRTVVIVLDDNDMGTVQTVLNRTKIVAKSFINDIYATGGVGQFPNTNPGAPLINVALNAFAVATNVLFLEDPISDDADGAYRLFTRRDLNVVCKDGVIEQAVLVRSDEIAGTEPGGVTGTIEIADPLLSLVAPNAGVLYWTAYGHPNPSVEPSFQAIAVRTSVNIYHKIGISFQCNADDTATFSLIQMQGSDFPSHRVWINQSLIGDIVQGPFVSLWRSEPSMGANFVTIDGNGPFAVQPLVGGGTWDPNE